jgi:hypothetical protein
MGRTTLARQEAAAMSETAVDRMQVRALAVALAGALGCMDQGRFEAAGGGPTVIVDYAPDCSNTLTRPIGLDETSPLGFSARDALAVVPARLDLALEWRPPFEGRSELRLQVQPGEASFVDGGPSSECLDRIDVAVGMRLDSADGRLSAAFSGAVSAVRADLVRLDQEIDAVAVARLFAGQTQQPAAAEVSAFFTPYGAAGELRTTNRTSPSNTLAVWPFTSLCGQGTYPVLNRDARPSNDELVDSVRGPRVLRELPGFTRVPLVLTPRPVPGGACYTPPFPSRRKPILVSIIDLELGRMDGGALPVLSIRRSWDYAFDDEPSHTHGLTGFGPCSQPGAVNAADFVARCGDWGVDLTGFTGAHLDVRGDTAGGIQIKVMGARGGPVPLRELYVGYP